MSRDIVHGIEIHAEPKAVFDTIATRSGLASFWTPDVQGDDHEGGELSFGFSGAPMRLPVRVARLDPPREVAWDCPGGFPFWEGTTVTWSIEPSEHGAKVVFRHDRFPEDQPEYDFGSIATTWGQIVTRLKEVVESGGTPNPVIS
jgi:uncharacterized protein YndB with AHSA1/START domain